MVRSRLAEHAGGFALLDDGRTLDGRAGHERVAVEDLALDEGVAEPDLARAFVAYTQSRLKHVRTVDELRMTATGEPQSSAMRYWMVRHGNANGESEE